tara:strand:- start:5124 stop:6185 length:1062 start_codon:yes stop_codon:yes gene_type:complete
MSTLKVNKITNVGGSGEIEVSLPLKLDEVGSAPTIDADYGYLYAKTDGKLYFNSNDLGEVDVSGSGVSVSTANTWTAGQLIDGGTAGHIQLRVQGHDSQSVDIASIEKSDGTTCLEVTSAGVVGIPLTTASSSTTTGALTIGGGLGIGGDIWAGGDIMMDHDASILKFGADNEVSLTHVHDTGLLLNSTNQLQFNNSNTYIHSNSGGELTLRASSKIKLNIGSTTIVEATSTGTTLNNINLKDYTETVKTDTNVDGTLVFNLNDGNIFNYTVTGDVDGIDFQNISAGQSWTVILRMDGSGGHAFPENNFNGETIKWNNGEVPTVDTTANKACIYTFFSPDGSEIFGMQTGYKF